MKGKFGKVNEHLVDREDIIDDELYDFENEEEDPFIGEEESFEDEENPFEDEPVTFEDEESIEEKTPKKSITLESEICISNTDFKKVKLDLDTIIPAESYSSNKLNLESGYLSIVDGGKCGHSIAIAKEVHTKLNLTDTVQVGFAKDCILLGKHIPNQSVNFKLKQSGTKRIIYSANLVREITKRLGLVFGEGNKTCITFYNLAFDETLDTPIAVISR